MKPTPRCRHTAPRYVGPRLSAHYGSWATEVCSHCASWRYVRGGCKGDKRWRAFRELWTILARDRKNEEDR